MFFRGFRASLHLNGKKHYDAIEFESANPICGAYRMNGDEFYADNVSQIIEARSSFIFEPPTPLRPSKNAINLPVDLPVTLQKKEVSMNPKGPEFEHQRNSRQDREPRKPDKDRTSKNNRNTTEIKLSNNKKSKAPPVPPPMLIDTQTYEYSKNTEKQSISRIDCNIERSLKTTGPPPYDLVSDKLEVIPNRRDMEIQNATLNNYEETLSVKRSSDDNIKDTEPVPRERKINKSFLDLNDNMDDHVNINNGSNEELV